MTGESAEVKARPAGRGEGRGGKFKGRGRDGGDRGANKENARVRDRDRPPYPEEAKYRAEIDDIGKQIDETDVKIVSWKVLLSFENSLP